MLQFRYGNQKLIYFLKKNKLDGFVTNVSFKNIKRLKVYLMFIKDSSDYELVFKHNNKGELDHLKEFNYTVTLYYFYILIIYWVKFYLFEDKSYYLIEDDIKKNERLDYLDFIKKYNFDSREINKNINKIRIASYNVHYFRDFYNNYTFDTFYNFVSKLDIDVLCLQEVVTPRKIYENIYLPNFSLLFIN